MTGILSNEEMKLWSAKMRELWKEVEKKEEEDKRRKKQ